MHKDSNAMSARILVVEDDLLMGENICEILRLNGYVVLYAVNGLEGLQLAREHKPDMILTDIMMPEMDGYEMMDELRKDPHFISTPIIYLTAKSLSEDILLGLKTGADDYISKPFDTQKLLDTVRFRLKQRSLLKQEAHLESCTDFVSTIAKATHVIANPLNTLMSGVDLLRDGDQTLSDEEIQYLYNLVQRSGKGLMHQLRNVVVSSEIQIGSYFKPIDSDITSMITTGFIQNIVKDASIIYEDRHKDVHLEVEDAALRIPSEPLFKAVLEIILNAMKFSLPGSPISIIGKKNGKWYELQVTDQGKGMAADQIDHLLPPYSVGQLKMIPRGHGYGVYIARNIADYYSGKFEITSELGIGSQISFRFPFE
jgi:two-component system, sensor histidine kinase and response regulator